MTHVKSKLLAFSSLYSINAFFVSVFMLLSLFFVNPVSAKTPDVDVAEKRVIAVTSKIVKLIGQNKALYARDKNALNTMIQREIFPFVDFTGMSKLILGKYWRTASATQRTRFINAFRGMLVRSYAREMIAFSGATIRGGNSVANKKPGYVLVRTAISAKGRSPTAANYSVRKIGNDWKAYNVEISGINMVTNFRTNFTREISAKGLDSLISRLEKSGRL